MTNLRELDLQLFAQSVEVNGETIEVDDEEIVEDDEIEVEDAVNEDEENDEETNEEDGTEENTEDEETDDEQKQEVLKDEENPAKNAVIAERRKWQKRMDELKNESAAAKRLMQQAGVKNLDELNQQMDSLEARKLEDQGIDPDQAKYFVTQQREMNDMKRQLQKQTFDMEIQNMQKNDFFSDIEDYRDEVEDYAVSKNTTLQGAYMALRGEKRMSEYQSILEQKFQNSQSKKQKKKVDTSTTGQGKPKSKVNLSQDELAIAKMAGITPEQYLKNKTR